MAMSHITRRSIVGAMIIAPAMVAVPAGAVTTDFAELHLAYKAALAREQKFDRDVLDPAYERFNRATAALPHVSVRWEATPGFAGETWSTADERRVKEARYMVDRRHSRPVTAEQEGYYKACVELVAAADARDAAMTYAKTANRIDELDEQSSELNEARCEARDALILCPVSSASELAIKMSLLTEHDQWDWLTAQEAITADVHRIARRGHES